MVQPIITASRFKASCRTNCKKPSLSLVKQICYPVETKFASRSTTWGITHEPTAIEKYVNYMSQKHSDFTYSECGLIINPEYPQFGASPDGLMSCSCCGSGSLEIKCPFSLRDISLQTYLKDKSSYLGESEGKIFLKEDHAYYYQVQAQIFLCKSKYADFVIWSPGNELFIQRIILNSKFCEENFAKAADFHEKVIFPELLARFFTKQPKIQQNWCICNEAVEKDMIKCDNVECLITWYHMDCLNLNSVPDVFICETCTNLSN